MFKFEKIFEKSTAPVYKNWEHIIDQLNKIRKYNIENNKTGFLHPAAASIIDDSQKININWLNNSKHDKKLFKPCAAPWGSAHINVDGTLFPCLAVDMGNVREGLENVIKGEKFEKFRSLIKKEGTVEACNRCGWLQPLN
tara:strand:- start:211 stop:630 length:420 start_codon:yes stop_codon:yes gene_type:complete